MKKIFVFPVLAILLFGCASSTPTPAAGTRPANTDPSAPIEAQAGETFNIVIDANPTTGYHWEILGQLDGNVVEFVSRDYIGDEPVMPGSGGVDVLTFNAVSAGETQITLGSFPPDPNVTEPGQSVTFDITVK
jgi:predicted secreted protein